MLFPFNSSPFSADHDSEPIPNGVTTWSTTLPPLSTCVTARYMFGDSGDHSAGLLTGIDRLASVSLPGATVTLDCALPACLPSRSISVVCTVTAASPAESLATRALTETFAALSEAPGVATKTPQCATCTGSVTTTRTCR